MLNKIIIFSSLLFYISNGLMGQGITNNWHLGYKSSLPNKCYLDFSSGMPVSNLLTRPMNFRSTSTTISDQNGNLQFYTNGVYIADATHDTMQNGSGLSPSLFTDVWKYDGLPLFGGILALPWPDNPDLYMLIHETLSIISPTELRPKKLLYSKINTTLNSGLGAVTNKNKTLINDTIEWGQLTATKHANGRDWWMIVREFLTERAYRIYINPSGIASVDTIFMGGPISKFGGQAAFSPDGRWYASFDNLSQLRVYNFNRCTGVLSNYNYIVLPDIYVAGGLSFSPNSKVMYISNAKHVYQYDLTSSNLANSKLLIATFDSTHFSPVPPFQCNFWWHMLGPDNKIYINSQASVFELHVINSPDSLGLACNLQQHSLNLGTYNKNTIPNHVNYYLGCDTTSNCNCLTTSINENSGNKNSIIISPIPSSGIVKIKVRDPIHNEVFVSVIDVAGRVVLSKIYNSISNSVSLDLSSFENGIYVCRFQTKNYSYSTRIILSK